MATDQDTASQRNVEDAKEEFYKKVRQRTAESWRKKYVTTAKEEEEAKKVLKRLRTKPESAYSIGVRISFLFNCLLISLGLATHVELFSFFRIWFGYWHP